MNGTRINASSNASPDIYNAKSVAEIKAILSELQAREATVTSQLDHLLNSQQQLRRELGRLDLFRVNLSTQAARTRGISNGMLSDAGSTAARISEAVRKLDLEKSRAQDTLTVVEQVRDLKSCVLGISGSMGAPQDWETAAGYLSRASRIPAEVIDGAFAARVVPTEEVPDSPRVTLETASESLCGLFLREFNKSVDENDGGKITRFFKLFPLINRPDAGLDVYGRYVCQGIASRARSNLNTAPNGNESEDIYFYANALTKLFEHIAQIIDGHMGLVERHYGVGKMTRVIERLQTEAVKQVGIILDTWYDERKVARLMTDIKSYAYTFLVQSFLPQQKDARHGTPRTGSPAPLRISEEESIDMHEVDAILKEMTIMLSKWSLYTRFLAEKCSASDAHQTDSSFFEESALHTKIANLIVDPFNTTTTFFTRRSFEKAFQLDESPTDLTLSLHKPILKSSPPYISSSIEDILFIIQKILRQTLSTSHLPVIISTLSAVTRILTSDFLGMEQRRMRDEHYPRPVVTGGLPPESTIVQFIILINNVDVASQHITSTVASIRSTIPSLFPSTTDAVAVTNSLQSLSTSFSEKSTSLLTEAITVLYTNVLKPRLRPILLDTFRDVDYLLPSTGSGTSSEDHALALQQHAEQLGFEAGDLDSFHDLVGSRFQHQWTSLTAPLARIMTDSTYAQLLEVTVSAFAKLLERRLWAYTGRVNSVGAARLERDVDNVVKVVVAGKNAGYKVRGYFDRVIQVGVILAMEVDEWEEVKETADSGVADKLSLEEMGRVREMLVD